jgi:hypothetical protein
MRTFMVALALGLVTSPALAQSSLVVTGVPHALSQDAFDEVQLGFGREKVFFLLRAGSARPIVELDRDNFLGWVIECYLQDKSAITVSGTIEKNGALAVRSIENVIAKKDLVDSKGRILARTGAKLRITGGWNFGSSSRLHFALAGTDETFSYDTRRTFWLDLLSFGEKPTYGHVSDQASDYCKTFSTFPSACRASTHTSALDGDWVLQAEGLSRKAKMRSTDASHFVLTVLDPLGMPIPPEGLKLLRDGEIFESRGKAYHFELKGTELRGEWTVTGRTVKLTLSRPAPAPATGGVIGSIGGATVDPTLPKVLAYWTSAGLGPGQQKVPFSFASEDAWRKWYDGFEWGKADAPRWLYRASETPKAVTYVLGSDDMWIERVEVARVTGAITVTAEH